MIINRMAFLPRLANLFKNIKIYSECCNSREVVDEDIREIRQFILQKLGKLENELERCNQHRISLIKQLQQLVVDLEQLHTRGGITSGEETDIVACLNTPQFQKVVNNHRDR